MFLFDPFFSELTSRFWLNWIEKLPVLIKLFNRFWCSLIWLFSFLKMWTPFQSWNKAKNILTKKEFSDANVSKSKMKNIDAQKVY